jgi:hypothetical protein
MGWGRSRPSSAPITSSKMSLCSRAAPEYGLAALTLIIFTPLPIAWFRQLRVERAQAAGLDWDTPPREPPALE